MPSVAEWDSVYNKTLELISKVRGALDLRGAVKDFSRVQAMLNIIANNINKMQNDLDTMASESAKYKLNDREVKRRQNMIEGLKREKTNCENTFVKNGGNLQAKNQLISHVNYDPENLTKQTDTDLHNMQEQVFAVQEQALEDISDTLGRLHDIGSAIGNEVDIQTKLLDEMESNTDNAQNRMAQESIRTKKVAKNSGMCKYYSTILLLLIILIFLIIQYIRS